MTDEDLYIYVSSFSGLRSVEFERVSDLYLIELNLASKLCHIKFYAMLDLIELKVSKEEILKMSLEERIAYKYLLC